MPIEALPVAEILSLNNDSFVPRGSTALLDAIGRTIDEMGARLAALPEEHRPGQVIVTILTDGMENSSQNYTWKEIARVIKQQTEQYRWTFLFLGANQDAIATAAQMSIAASNAASYVADAAGLHASAGSLTRKVRARRCPTFSARRIGKSGTEQSSEGRLLGRSPPRALLLLAAIAVAFASYTRDRRSLWTRS